MIYYVDIYGGDWKHYPLPKLETSDIENTLRIFQDSEYKMVTHLSLSDPQELFNWYLDEEYTQERYLCFRLTETRYAEFLLTFS